MLYGYSITVSQNVFGSISMNMYEYERKTLNSVYQGFFPVALPLNSFSLSEITGNCIVLETEIKVSFLVIMG